MTDTGLFAGEFITTETYDEFLLPPPPPSHWRLSDFEVRPAVIGHGALGRVYMCRLKNFKSSPWFAMKIMKKIELVRLRQAERVIREAKLQMRVSAKAKRLLELGAPPQPPPAATLPSPSAAAASEAPPADLTSASTAANLDDDGDADNSNNKNSSNSNNETTTTAATTTTAPTEPPPPPPECQLFVQLHRTFADEKRVYFIEEHAAGGELFARLRSSSRFPLDVARFYAAELVLAIAYLHNHEKMVFRDLTPDNILLDDAGHIKICDFGASKCLWDVVEQNAAAAGDAWSSHSPRHATMMSLSELRTYSIVGVPEYTAPEIVAPAVSPAASPTAAAAASGGSSEDSTQKLFQGHGVAVDYWSLGVVIFEMLAGFPPFFDDTPQKIFEKASKASRSTIPFPSWFDARTKDLLSGLLNPDPTKRLGSLKRGVTDIMKHRWFAAVDWQAMKARKVPPPEFVRDAIAPRIVPPAAFKKAAVIVATAPSPLLRDSSSPHGFAASSAATLATVEGDAAAAAAAEDVVAAQVMMDVQLNFPFDRYPESDSTTTAKSLSPKPLTEAQQRVFAVFSD